MNDAVNSLLTEHFSYTPLVSAIGLDSEKIKHELKEMSASP